MRPSFLPLILVAIVSFAAPAAHAAWPYNGAPICTAANDQWGEDIIADGSGGAFIAWHDGRSGVNRIYVQRVNAAGVPQWTPDGQAVTTTADQGFPVLALDGAGGVIVTWHDTRNGATDIYAQRLNGAGTPVWKSNGVGVCTALYDQNPPKIVSDGAGGAIITWEDFRGGFSSDIYAQRIDSGGAAVWAKNGVAICLATGNQSNPMIVSDGASGAIVAWADYRSGGNGDIYARRVDAGGSVLWTANGVALCANASDQFGPVIVSDGVGGAIVAWNDSRNGNGDIYAQRTDGSGVPLWSANGVAVCTAVQTQLLPVIATDGAGGAFIAWSDTRSVGGAYVYAQRMNGAGTAQWLPDGLNVSIQGAAYASIAPDGSGGAIIAFMGVDATYDIFAQRIDANGAWLWPSGGTWVSVAGGDQEYPLVVSDGAGAGIVVWTDLRGASPRDIYAERVAADGYWGYQPPVITSVGDVPGDQGGKVKLNYLASDHDIPGQQFITYYSVWRATDPVAAASMIAANPSLLVDASDVGPDFTGPAFRVERTTTTNYYWEWMGSQNAQYFAGYRFTVATTADSSGAGPATNYFQVLAHTANQFVFWASDAVSAHSVDNLAPAAPLLLTAQRVGSDVHLTWRASVAPDLRDYSVYRQSSSGVTPVPGNFLSSASDTVMVDTNAPAGALYYIVTANDVHDNQSGASNEAAVDAPTGVGGTPSIATLTLLANRPNPFSGSTEFEIGLPSASRMHIAVYDVAGRLVRQFDLSERPAGWQRVAFDGLDENGRALASGVYFCKVTANGAAIARKMVIAR